MNKNIRSKVVRESLLDYNTLANTLKENTKSAVKSLLDEAVRDTYTKLLSEEDNDEDKYEEKEVEDTGSDTATDVDTSDATEDEVDNTDTGTDVDSDEVEDDEDIDSDDIEPSDTEIEDDVDDDMSDEIDDVADDGEDGDEWAEFDKYKVSDDEYDFTNAEDEEIVKVYKLMKNDDQILVHKDDNGNVNIQDNETGAEYLITLGDDDASSVGATDSDDDNIITDDEDDFGAEDDFDDENELINDEDDMNESTEKMFELVLEYDSNVGYTDNYQKKDVMTNPGMSEPGKNVNDWDAGVPHGTEKPWSGYKGGKKNKADAPFNAGKGKQVEEQYDFEVLEDSDGLTEATNVGGFVQQNSTSKSHVPNSNGRKARSMSKGGKRVTGTATPRYNSGDIDVTVTVNGDEKTTNENFMRRANKVLSENKELKTTLTDVMGSLKEAAVTNHNLAQIIKLISENTTSQDEKREIITRFSKEAKTIEASKNLYESISRDLKKSNKMNITEDKRLTVEGSKKINETTIYKSPDVLETLDLMHRMMK